MITKKKNKNHYTHQNKSVLNITTIMSGERKVDTLLVCTNASRSDSFTIVQRLLDVFDCKHTSTIRLATCNL